MVSTINRLSNSTAKLDQEYEETAAMLAPLIKRAEEEDARNKRPKYKFFDGVTCLNPQCLSNAVNRPPEHKAYFVPSDNCLACTMCGCQQPGSQIMIQDQEKRNFEDGPDHRRTERLHDDKTGTRPPQRYASAHRLVEKGVDTDSETEARKQRYATKIDAIADQMVAFTPDMRSRAKLLANKTASAITKHRDRNRCRCRDKKCVLNRTPREATRIAAVLMRKTQTEHKVPAVEFSDYAGTYLPKVGDHTSNEYDLGRVSDVVEKLIIGYDKGTFVCEESAKPAEPVKPAEPAKPAESVKPAEPVKPAQTTQTTQSAPSADAPNPYLVQLVGYVDRISDDINLEHPKRHRAKQVVADWFRKGLVGGQYRSIAGAAIWYVVKDDGGDVEAIANVLGRTPDTIKNTMRKHLK